MRQQEYMYQWALLIGVIVVAILATAIGSVMIPIGDVWHIIVSQWGEPWQGNPAIADIVWQIRVPRVVLAGIAGAGLALSGVVMQATVQNPLAEPFILGIASGASVGAVFVILMGYILSLQGLNTSVMIGAFIGATISTISVLLLGGLRSRLSTVRLVLAGAVVSALCTALSNFIIYMSGDAEGIQMTTFWTMGSLSGAKWSALTLPLVVVVGVTVYFLTQLRYLDALLLGEDSALTLGVDVVAKRRWYMALIALVTGVLVSQTGVIGFVGLVIPHMTRSFVGAVHRRLLPAAVLIGAIFLIGADLLSRTLLPSGDLPIGIVTALLGAPLFMKLLFGKAQHFGG